MIDTILNRCSIRKYTEQNIKEEDINTLLRAGFAAPCSKDSRCWHFIVLDDKEIMTSLGQNLTYAHMLEYANKAILVCAEREKAPLCWSLDCSAASENILLAAESLGIGACWTAVYPYKDREEVVRKNMPDIPLDVEILCIIPLGYPAKEKRIKEKYDISKIHRNKW